MKTRLHFFISFVLCSLLYCATYSQTPKDNSYFPLNIGNQWIYTSSASSSPDTITIVDTQRVGGKLYYAFKERQYIYSWFRKDNNRIYIVDTAAFKLDSIKIREYLVYDFSENIGSSWDVPLATIYFKISCNYGGKIRLESKNDSAITPARVFTNCFCFLHGSPCRDAGVYKEWFALGIGKVAFEEESYSGIIKYSLSQSNIITGIPDNNISNYKGEYRLWQNYPNPFNPITQIKYSIPQQGYVSLEVFNMLGQKVETLFEGIRAAGNYEIKFDGSKLASGVYFYKMHVENYSDVKSLILIK
jgi:hypothetical protein